ncbi:MAG: hypothetical protein ABI415_02530 [Flavitalea sp.]
MLIGISFFIAAPAGFYLMHQWLAGFYYRTTIGWEVFVITFLVSLVIAWISVEFKAVRAALRTLLKV